MEAEHHSRDFYVSTAEVAEILNDRIDRGFETVENIARRTGLLPRAIFRVRKAETVGTTSRVAEALLEAVGASLSDLPSYYNGFELPAKRNQELTHGKRYAYRKGCRCDVCVAAHEERKAQQRAARYPKSPTSVPIAIRKQHARIIHEHPTLDPQRGIAVV